MKIRNIDGQNYRLPNSLSKFQLQLYVHLINWKWQHITQNVGYSMYQGQSIEYDAILPEEFAGQLRLIYPAVIEELRRHQGRNDFRLHNHFNHMASSQAANVNLFLPVLQHPRCNEVLSKIRPDFASLATEHLDQGYCLEYWGGNFKDDSANRGPLGDKSGSHGTDSDIAIAYRNWSGELCLWLIEHKLTEREFTHCSGPKSRDRDQTRHNCGCTFSEIVARKSNCFHHDHRERKYWDITEENRDFFVNHSNHSECPFKSGTNQLWRNQLLAFAIESDNQSPYEHASFSVVKHPANPHLGRTLTAFQDLVGHNSKFSVFTSKDVNRSPDCPTGSQRCWRCRSTTWPPC
jgi:hypothetical protein